MKLLFRIALNALAIMIVAKFVSGVAVSGFGIAVLAACVLGLVNGLIRPLLHVLALPITILTFGLFALVINGLTFGLAAGLVPGFKIAGFAAAFWGALLYSALSYVINGILLKGEE